MDIEKNEKTKFQKTYLFELDSSEKNQNAAKLLNVSRPQPLRSSEYINVSFYYSVILITKSNFNTHRIWNVKAPNNLYNAILTNWKDNNEDKQFIEVFFNLKIKHAFFDIRKYPEYINV